MDEADTIRQYRRFREETDAHFGSSWNHEPIGSHRRKSRRGLLDAGAVMGFGSSSDESIHRLSRYIRSSARRMNLPCEDREDIVQDALCEILEELGRNPTELLLQDISESSNIIDILKNTVNGRAARRVVKRVLARVRYPQPTMTDIGMGDAIDS